LQIEVFHYIEFLRSNYAKQNNVTVETLEKKKLKSVTDLAFGKEKSQYSDDFDAPMEEFDGYM